MKTKHLAFFVCDRRQVREAVKCHLSLAVSPAVSPAMSPHSPTLTLTSIVRCVSCHSTHPNRPVSITEARRMPGGWGQWLGGERGGTGRTPVNNSLYYIGEHTYDRWQAWDSQSNYCVFKFLQSEKTVCNCIVHRMIPGPDQFSLQYAVSVQQQCYQLSSSLRWHDWHDVTQHTFITTCVLCIITCYVLP